MKIKKYGSDEIIEYAALVQRSLAGTDYSIHEVLRKKFPGITDYAIRKAVKDARLLLAFRSLLREAKDE